MKVRDVVGEVLDDLLVDWEKWFRYFYDGKEVQIDFEVEDKSKLKVQSTFGA